MSSGEWQLREDDEEQLVKDTRKIQARIQSYGTTLGHGEGPDSTNEADGYASLPSATHASESLGFQVLPPRFDEPPQPAAPKDRKPLSGLPVISEEQARLAMLEHCSANCCYGSRAAKDMTVLDMNSTYAFHYTLETFTEQRSTAWAQVPYTGLERLDTAMRGPAPLPWDISVHVPEKFRTTEKRLEVPHTASVIPCTTCEGSGYNKCNQCEGHGEELLDCIFCNGTGWDDVYSERRLCSYCSGSGHKQCSSCSGSGRERCSTCDGCCKLKRFKELTVTWTNHFEDYILERTAMPDELIREAHGQLAFQEEQPWLYPINHCPEQLINEASVDLIEKHRIAFSKEKRLLQRHAIRIVPVTEVKCRWKQDSFTLFVYGLESCVYTSDYPQMCCCGCSIL